MPIERAVYHSGSWVVFWTAPGAVVPTGNPTASFTAIQQKPSGVVNFNSATSTAGTGTIAKYTWDFGDNSPQQSSTTALISHTYAKSGTYSVTLTVTNSVGSTAKLTSAAAVAISQAPTPSFTTSTSGLSVNVDATLSAAASGLSIASYQWNFGDGGTTTGVTAGHTYSTPGNYTVTLVVTDNVGASATLSHAVEITVQMTADFVHTSNGLTLSVDGSPSVDANPIVSYAWDFGIPVAVIATPVVAGASAAFDGTGSYVTGHSIASYAWTFGDGTSGTGSAPTHVYAFGGNYTVTLTVTDDNGIHSAPVSVGVTVSIDSFVYGQTKPNAANTGVGVIAPAPTSANTTTYTGDYTFSTDGSISNLHITGRLIVNGGNVTVKNCIIDRHVDINGSGNLTIVNSEVRINQLRAASTDTWGIYTHTASAAATIQFCTIHATMSPMSIYVAGGVGSQNLTVDRCNIYDVMDGIDTYNTTTPTGALNTVIKGNYIHGLNYLTPEPRQSDNVTHCDCLQISGGDGMEVFGNYHHAYAGQFSNAPKYVAGTHPQALSAIMITPNTGPVTNTNIHDNWFDGGEITFNAGALDRQGGANTGSANNNRFGHDSWSGATQQMGFDAAAVGKWTATGNVFEDNGSPIIVHWNY